MINQAYNTLKQKYVCTAYDGKNTVLPYTLNLEIAKPPQAKTSEGRVPQTDKQLPQSPFQGIS